MPSCQGRRPGHAGIVSWSGQRSQAASGSPLGGQVVQLAARTFLPSPRWSGGEQQETVVGLQGFGGGAAAALPVDVRLHSRCGRQVSSRNARRPLRNPSGFGRGYHQRRAVLARRLQRPSGNTQVCALQAIVLPEDWLHPGSAGDGPPATVRVEVELLAAPGTESMLSSAGAVRPEAQLVASRSTPAEAATARDNDEDHVVLSTPAASPALLNFKVKAAQGAAGDDGPAV